MDAVNRYKVIFRDKVYPIFNQYIDNDRVTAHILHGNNKKVFILFIKPAEF